MESAVFSIGYLSSYATSFGCVAFSARLCNLPSACLMLVKSHLSVYQEVSESFLALRSKAGADSMPELPLLYQQMTEMMKPPDVS